ncbi:Lrp/AsnC family transcriptional regulator [Saccharothrix variisporea]|uniref:Lrp/AsnC family transcriptional regulator n=1 Tax=Saccharothrix variisporea TaxID=543527 RepID=UPI000EAF08D4|nr:Lrp/AsnC family transcriptional regulator [Saccharothrix variisporea]
MDSVTLDPLDRRLLHALQLDGRAPFSRIAAVLEVSDRTLSRRFDRLRARGLARVSAAPHGRAAGLAEWVVRLRVRPHAAAGLARALAGRADTAWVTVLSSGTEVFCIFRVPEADPAPLAVLSRHPHVVDVTAQRVLRHLMDHRWRGRTSALTPDQAAALRSPRAGAPGPTALTDLDRGLFAVLARDGRAACVELAREVGWSDSAVRRRLDDLRDAGLLEFHVEVEPRLFGYTAQCLLWLRVTPARLSAVATSLAGDAETAFLGAITGSHNLIAVVICRDADALYAHLADRIGALDGVEHVEAADITSYSKRFAPSAASRSGA